MKVITLILLLSIVSGCMLLPPQRPQDPSRKVYPAISDLDNLEMLLLNDQQPIYQNTRQLSGTDNLHLGMGKSRVQNTLGQPSVIEVAGNPKYENERWVYERSVPTLKGYYKEKRVIYFEGGNVVGWESE